MTNKNVYKILQLCIYTNIIITGSKVVELSFNNIIMCSNWTTYRSIVIQLSGVGCLGTIMWCVKIGKHTFLGFENNSGKKHKGPLFLKMIFSISVSGPLLNRTWTWMPTILTPHTCMQINPAHAAGHFKWAFFKTHNIESPNTGREREKDRHL